ncbi:MAG: glutamate racemase [Defluviitaleaceae bacterium]|nr:glutamate racemase [Defluviitaleaceae bacterium]
MSNTKSPIGIFDSGVGGLTVVQEVRKLMPTESIVYVGDTARAPYGGKDTETLINHGREIINFLLKKNAKMIIMACGTSSSTSLEVLRKEFEGLPIVDTIRPAVKATLELTQQGEDIKPVFIATAATIKSGIFERLFTESLEKVPLYTRACPLFAPMVEAGLTTIENHPLPIFAAQTYLADLRGKVNALVLGCTHYPLLKGALSHVLGDITFINPAIATAEAAKNLLPPSPETIPEVDYYTSGEPEKFAKIARYILKEDCKPKKATFAAFFRRT